MKLFLLSSLLLFSFLPLTAKAQINASEARAMLPEALLLWEKRADKTTLEECLFKFETIQQGLPTDIDILVYLARGYFLVGELSQNEGEKMRVYEKAKNFGFAGMALNPDFKKLMDKDIEKAVGTLSKKEVPSAFWTAAALGRWSKLNGVMSSLKYKEQMLAMVKKVETLDSTYMYGAVYRFWGGFYAVAPSIAGGDMKKSKANFDKVIKMYPEYIGSLTGYAELYLVEADKEKEFKKVLQQVVSMRITGPKEIEPENFLEKKKAEYLLKKTKELF